MLLFSADAKIFLEKFKKQTFAHKKLKKPPQKVAYLWQLGVFFSSDPTARNSLEPHFRFINSFIQPSRVGSLLVDWKFLLVLFSLPLLCFFSISQDFLLLFLELLKSQMQILIAPPSLWPAFHRMVFCYQNCSDLLWEKIVLVIEKNFWNSRLKAKNLQNFWDH